jgi:hypothetical protein
MEKNMKLGLFLSIISVLTVFSCGSTPANPVNNEFQNTTGMNLTFIKRGIASIPKTYKN